MLDQTEGIFQFYELDMQSCHTHILASLMKSQTPKLNAVLDDVVSNIWSEIIKGLPKELEKMLGYNLIKRCLKKVCYKCFQGGRVDTWEKIQSTLKDEARSSGKDFIMLAQVLHKTPLVREFDCLNAKIKDRFESAPT
jgi:hypothetical protein